eukprot:6903286-Pyramimonas_sp.AAC.1
MPHADAAPPSEALHLDDHVWRLEADFLPRWQCRSDRGEALVAARVSSSAPMQPARLELDGE